jgi:hypothetical protein
MSELRVRLISQAVVALLVGCWIYIVWRTDELLMFGWFRALGLRSFVAVLREQPVAALQPIDWIRFSLPDGLWVYASTCVMLAIWATPPGSGGALPASLLWLCTPSAFAILSELAQGLALLPGTFDLADLACYLLAGPLAVVSERFGPALPANSPASGRQ